MPIASNITMMLGGSNVHEHAGGLLGNALALLLVLPEFESGHVLPRPLPPSNGHAGLVGRLP